MAKGLFITAVGTDVGKTYVTALLVKRLRESGYRAGYYKAALSGAEERNGQWIPGDADYVKRIAGLPDDYCDLVSYVYRAAVSPHLAAQMEGNPVSLDRVCADYNRAAQKYDLLTVEGSGGIVCPVRWDETEQIMLTDVIKALHLPVLIVANAALGSINAVVLTVSYAQQQNIPVKGIILNQYQEEDPMQVDNRRMMEKLTGIPVLGVVKENENDLHIAAAQLEAIYE